MKEVEVRLGVTEAQIEELIAYSNTDITIRRYTLDFERFRDRKSFDEWFSKERFVYCLTNESGKLWGISWFGEKEMPVREFSHGLS